MGLFNISLIYVHYAEKKAEEAYYSGKECCQSSIFSVLVKSYTFINQT